MQASDMDTSSSGLCNQFQKLQCSTDVTREEAVTSPSIPASSAANSSARACGVRSVSNAGIPSTTLSAMTPPPPSQSRAQTAPPLSGSYYGFAYPYNYQYANNFVYSNNNSMYPPTMPTVDQNLLFYPTQNSYVRSLSPVAGAPNYVPSPAAEDETEKTASSDKTAGCSSPSNTARPVIPPRPAGYRMQGPSGSYVYLPCVSVGTSSSSSSLHDVSSGLRSPPPPTISESPENSASFHLQNTTEPAANVSPNIPRKDFNSQLHVNIESSDTSVHEWRPFQTYSPHNQPVMQPMPFQMSPNFSGYQPVYHHGDRTVDQIPPNLPVPQPVFVPIPYPSMPYPPPPPNVYYPVPTSGQILIPSYDFQQYVSQQRHHLNILRYEHSRSLQEKDKLKAEVTELENSLKENSSLPGKSDIEKLNKEISKLRLECYCLCAEVDEHYKGKVPLGEINEDFYSCINTGQDGPLHSSSRIEGGGGGTQAEHPRHRVSLEEDEENQETNKWTCSKCTFQNHPAITVCEICQVGENIACST